DMELADLKRRNDASDALATYTRGVLSDYLSNFESRIHLAEDQAYSNHLAEIRARLDEPGVAPREAIDLYLGAVEQGLARQEKLVGGYVFPGRAITPSGGVKNG